MYGVMARRRTVHFGRTHDFQTFQLSPAAEIPEFLHMVREPVGGLTDLIPADFREDRERAANLTQWWHRPRNHPANSVGRFLLPIKSAAPGNRMVSTNGDRIRSVWTASPRSENRIPTKQSPAYFFPGDALR